jgi:hypothetical protein
VLPFQRAACVYTGLLHTELLFVNLIKEIVSQTKKSAKHCGSLYCGLSCLSISYAACISDSEGAALESGETFCNTSLNGSGCKPGTENTSNVFEHAAAFCKHSTSTSAISLRQIRPVAKSPLLRTNLVVASYVRLHSETDCQYLPLG